MFVDIESFLFNSLVNTQTVDLLDAIEQDDSAYSSPEVDHEYTEALSTEESPTATVEGACLCSQQTSHDSTQDTTHTVYRACTYGVVNM